MDDKAAAAYHRALEPTLKGEGMKVVLVYSGGLDSTVLLYHLLAAGHEVKALSINYGQRHRKELAAARAIAAVRGVENRLVDLTPLAELFPDLGLISSTIPIPQVSYSPESMALTTVPNRNMTLLSVALAWAAHLGFDAAAYAAHAGTTTYPDCRPEFAAALDRAARLCDWKPLQLLAPFVTWTKGDIVRRGTELSVPFARTWSCYAGGDKHCGRCGTCRDRREAFAAAGVPDPTEYA
jgi:7-cyano-7-deazaguanine synthase